MADPRENKKADKPADDKTEDKAEPKDKNKVEKGADAAGNAVWNVAVPTALLAAAAWTLIAAIAAALGSESLQAAIERLIEGLKAGNEVAQGWAGQVQQAWDRRAPFVKAWLQGAWSTIKWTIGVLVGIYVLGFVLGIAGGLCHAENFAMYVLLAVGFIPYIIGLIIQHVFGIRGSQAGVRLSRFFVKISVVTFVIAGFEAGWPSSLSDCTTIGLALAAVMAICAHGLLEGKWRMVMYTALVTVMILVGINSVLARKWPQYGSVQEAASTTLNRAAVSLGIMGSDLPEYVVTTAGMLLDKETLKGTTALAKNAKVFVDFSQRAPLQADGSKYPKALVKVCVLDGTVVSAEGWYVEDYLALYVPEAPKPKPAPKQVASTTPAPPAPVIINVVKAAEPREDITFPIEVPANEAIETEYVPQAGDLVTFGPADKEILEQVMACTGLPTKDRPPRQPKINPYENGLWVGQLGVSRNEASAPLIIFNVDEKKALKLDVYVEAGKYQQSGLIAQN